MTACTELFAERCRCSQGAVSRPAGGHTDTHRRAALPGAAEVPTGADSLPTAVHLLGHRIPCQRDVLLQPPTVRRCCFPSIPPSLSTKPYAAAASPSSAVPPPPASRPGPSARLPGLPCGLPHRLPQAGAPLPAEAAAQPPALQSGGAAAARDAGGLPRRWHPGPTAAAAACGRAGRVHGSHGANVCRHACRQHARGRPNAHGGTRSAGGRGGERAGNCAGGVAASWARPAALMRRVRVVVHAHGCCAQVV